MSMAPSMNCQYCGKRLALLRRLNKGQFCTAEHREAYQTEQQGLAVQRLIEARWPDKKPVAAKPQPSFNADVEEEFLPEPPAPGISGREQPIFLNVAPAPRRLDGYALCFADIFPAMIAPILPEALKLKRRYAGSGNQIPLEYTISLSNPPIRARCAPYVEPDVSRIFRPEFQSRIEERKFPARIESPVSVGCIISFKVGDSAPAPGMTVQPQPCGTTPQMPRLRGQTKWLPGILEIQSNLPMGRSVALLSLQAFDLKAETESPRALAACFGIILPGLSGYRAKVRFPPCSGKIGWAEPRDDWRAAQAWPRTDFLPAGFANPRFSDSIRGPVFEKKGGLLHATVTPRARPPNEWIAMALAETPLPPSTAAVLKLPGFVQQKAEDWIPPHVGRLHWPDPVSMLVSRRKPCQQVRHDSSASGVELFKPRFSQCRRVSLLGQCSRLIPTYGMPGIRRPAAMDCTGSIQQLEPVQAVFTQLARTHPALKAIFRANIGMNLLKIMPCTLSPAMERAVPIEQAPEEFHTWLDVPLFEAGQPAKRVTFANLSGKAGLDRILANPRQAATGKLDDLLPSFCGLTPLLIKSPLKAIGPLSLARKGRGGDDLETKIRNELTSKFTLRGIRFWRIPPLRRKWAALGLTILIAGVFLGFSQQRHAIASKAESRIATGTQPAKPPGAEQPRELDPEQTLLTPVRNFFDRRIQNLQLNMAERANVQLTDDFRSGFTAWEGAGDWARTWTFDRIGLLRPGQLAIYGPSKELSDYTFEFSASAGHGSIGWVFRARDLKNYYGMRLQMSRSGAGAQASLERWIVAGGRERARKFIPVRMPAWDGDISRVKVAVEGSSFITSVNGQIADTWTDTQIGWGGIGFFNEKGGDTRIHKMSVSHQADMLGKLCAMLTPHGMILKQQSGKERNFR